MAIIVVRFEIAIFEHFETASDIMIRFSGASILFSVQNQLKLHRKINYRLKTGSQRKQRSGLYLGQDFDQVLFGKS